MNIVIKIIVVTFVLGIAVSASGQNYKIKQKTPIGGSPIETTVFVKGSRQRRESGGYMGMGAGEMGTPPLGDTGEGGSPG